MSILEETFVLGPKMFPNVQYTLCDYYLWYILENSKEDSQELGWERGRVGEKQKKRQAVKDESGSKSLVREHLLMWLESSIISPLYGTGPRHRPVNFQSLILSSITAACPITPARGQMAHVWQRLFTFVLCSWNHIFHLQTFAEKTRN